jgi:hypothetical protein
MPQDILAPWSDKTLPTLYQYVVCTLSFQNAMQSIHTKIDIKPVNIVFAP